MPKPWQNGEGYPDPTAYAGLKPVIQEDAEREKRVNTLIFVLKYIIKLAGFDLLKFKCSRCAYFYRTMVGGG